MTQYQQVIKALQKIGGSGTLDEICNAIENFEQWGARNPRASVSRYLSMGKEITKQGNNWVYNIDSENEKLLYCSDGVLATAIAKRTSHGWELMGISEVHGFGNASFDKILFNTSFDDIIPFCNTTGISYVAVKKEGLWGLIRLRLNPEYAYDKEFYKKTIGEEPFDKKFMDPIGREIKLIEDIKYKNINVLKTQYHLGSVNQIQSSQKYSNAKNCWSKELRNETYDIVYNGRCPDICQLKHWNGRFGTISTFTGVLKNIWNVKIIETGGNETGEVETFYSVNDLIAAGWVID